MNTNTPYITAHFTAASQGTYRYETYQGRRHLVVPYIGLVEDIVMRPHGSRGASLVPGPVISRVAGSWNGRPVIMDHPFDSSGTPLSVNSSKDLHERFAYGTVFNTRYEDGCLKGELWLDPERAALVGAEAVDVINRALSGEKIEVSVGAKAYEEPDSGTSPSGRPYAYRWVHAEADHLATLPRDTPGACSWEMGCGVRAASGLDNDNSTDTFPTPIKERAPMKSSLISALGLVAAEDLGLSTDDIRFKLYEAIRSVEPAFEYVVEVYPDAKIVIYCVSPNNNWTYIQRTYDVSGDVVSLGADRTEVESEVSWVPVAADPDAKSESSAEDASEGEASVAASAQISAAKKLTPVQRLMRMIRDLAHLHTHLTKTESSDSSYIASTAPTPASASTLAASNSSGATSGGESAEGDNCMCQIKDLAGRLIASARAPFDEKDRAYLESQPVEKLTSLLALSGEDAPTPKIVDAPAAVAAAAATTTTATTPTPAAPAQVFTEDQILKAFPRLAGLVSAAEAHDKLAKTRLVNVIAARSKVWALDELVTKPLDELSKIATALGLDGAGVDFSLQGASLLPGVADPDAASYKIPDSYQLDKVPALNGNKPVDAGSKDGSTN